MKTFFKILLISTIPFFFFSFVGPSFCCNYMEKLPQEERVEILEQIELPELNQIYYTIALDNENDIEIKFVHKYHNEEIKGNWFPLTINELFEWVENEEVFFYTLN